MSITQKIKAVRLALRRRAEYKGGLQDFTPGVATDLPEESRYTLEEIAEVYTAAQRMAQGAPVRWREETDGAIACYAAGFVFITPAKQGAAIAP